MTSNKFFIKITILILMLLTFSMPVLYAQSDQEVEKSEFIQVEQVLLPGGEFIMGKEGESDFSPPHKIHVDSFYMDKYEVTNAQYFEFCKATGRSLPEFWGMARFHSNLDFPHHPVVGIGWSDANDYAKWIGKRLPTEAEWEYAARGGLVDMNYPHGNELDSNQANHTLTGLEGTVPVGSFLPNAFGLYDMAGNVWEWVADYYDEEYYKTSPVENPPGPEDGKFKVIRGGGWHSGPFCNRVYYRQALPPHWVDIAVGFRCVKDLR